jgi:hypothetical protein
MMRMWDRVRPSKPPLNLPLMRFASGENGPNHRQPNEVDLAGKVATPGEVTQTMAEVVVAVVSFGALDAKVLRLQMI